MKREVLNVGDRVFSTSFLRGFPIETVGVIVSKTSDVRPRRVAYLVKFPNEEPLILDWNEIRKVTPENMIALKKHLEARKIIGVNPESIRSNTMAKRKRSRRIGSAKVMGIPVVAVAIAGGIWLWLRNRSSAPPAP